MVRFFYIGVFYGFILFLVYLLEIWSCYFINRKIYVLEFKEVDRMFERKGRVFFKGWGMGRFIFGIRLLDLEEVCV